MVAVVVYGDWCFVVVVVMVSGGFHNDFWFSW